MGISNEDHSTSNDDDSESEPERGSSTVITRKRKRKVTTDSSDDNLPENMLQVEENICAIQLKNNMTDEGVKKILKKVVSNEHVVALVKLREEEEIEAEEIEAEEAPTLKITRSKAKELRKSGECVESPAIPWSLALTPVKSIPLRTSPELTALISSQQLPEDESDEEYQPNDEEHVSEDDHDTIGTCSDIESQPRTPATPASSLHDDTPHSPTHFDDEGVFKLPKDIVKTPNKPQLTEEDEVTIARRTRSKLCLSDTSIDQLEESFVPPDSVPTRPLDPLWKDFLTDITNPENHNHEEDDEADPDFNYAVAVEEILDADHQLEEERPVNISRKELNDLISELCEGYFEVPLVNMDPMGSTVSTDLGPPMDTLCDPSLDPTGPVTMGVVPVLHDAQNLNGSSEENQIILDISNSKPDFTIKCDDPELDITETQFAEMEVITAEQRQKLENETVQQSSQSQEAAPEPEKEVSALPNSPTGDDISYFKRTVGLKQDTVLHFKSACATSEQTDVADKILTMQLPEDSETVIYAEQCEILSQQMRQHVQFATQFYIELYCHPELWKKAPDFKEMLDELDVKAKGKEKSYYRPCNLNDAQELCSEWEEKLSVESEENLAMMKFIQDEVAKTRKRKQKCALYIAKFPEKFMDIISGSKVFLYPYLLPPAPIRLDRSYEKKRNIYEESELHLMALGLEQFYKYAISNPEVEIKEHKRFFNFPLIAALITKYMLPMHKTHKLVSIYTNSRRKTTNNPINYYFRMGKTLPVVHTILPYYPNFTLMDYRPEELPIIWVRHVHKMGLRKAYEQMRIRPFGIKPKGRNINLVIPTDSSKKNPNQCENEDDVTKSEPPIKRKKANSDEDDTDENESKVTPTRITRSLSKKIKEALPEKSISKAKSPNKEKRKKKIITPIKSVNGHVDNSNNKTEQAPAFRIVIPQYPSGTSILVPKVVNGMLIFAPQQDCPNEITKENLAKEVNSHETVTTLSCKTPIVTSEFGEDTDNETAKTKDESGKWLSVRKNLIQVPVQSLSVPSPSGSAAPVTHTTISIDEADQEDSVFGLNFNAENCDQRDKILAVLKKLAERSTHADDCECKCLLAKCVASAAQHKSSRGQKLISNYFKRVSTPVHKNTDKVLTPPKQTTIDTPALTKDYHEKTASRHRTDSERSEVIEDSATESESVTTDRLEHSCTPSPIHKQETRDEHFFTTSRLLLLLELNKDALINKQSKRIEVPDNFNIWLALIKKVTISMEEMLPSMPFLQTADSRDTNNEVSTGNVKDGKKLQIESSECLKNTTTSLNTNTSQRPGRRKCKVIKDWNPDETITNTRQHTEHLNEDYLVTAYFEKVQARFNTQSDINTCSDNHKFLEFQTLLDNFSVEKSSPCDLFRDVEKLLGEKNADLCEEFLIFLTPGQAASVGRFMEHFMLTRMSEFIEGLQKYFAAKPASLRKVLKALERGLSGAEGGGGLSALRAAILPQLKGSQELTEWFLSFMSDERPPDSVYDNDMVEVVTDSSWGEGDEGAEVWEAGWTEGEGVGGACECRRKPPPTATTATFTRRTPSGCLSCDLTYMEGGLLVQRGRAMRPVSVRFPQSTHTHAHHAYRLAARTHTNPHNDSDDERTSPKRTVKPVRTPISKNKHKVMGGKQGKNNENSDGNIQRVCVRSIIKEEIIPATTIKPDSAAKQSIDKSSESNMDAHSVTDMRLVYEDSTDVDMDIEETVIGRDVAHQSHSVSESCHIPENISDSSVSQSCTESECTDEIPENRPSLLESLLRNKTSVSHKNVHESSKNMTSSHETAVESRENITELSDKELANQSPLTSLKTEGTDWTREEDKTILQVLQCDSDPHNTFERINELLPHRSLQEIRERFLNVMNLLQKMASGDVT